MVLENKLGNDRAWAYACPSDFSDHEGEGAGPSSKAITMALRFKDAAISENFKAIFEEHRDANVKLPQPEVRPPPRPRRVRRWRVARCARVRGRAGAQQLVRPACMWARGKRVASAARNSVEPRRRGGARRLVYQRRPACSPPQPHPCVCARVHVCTGASPRACSVQPVAQDAAGAEAEGGAEADDAAELADKLEEAKIEA